MEDDESPQVCLSFLGVPIRSLQDSSYSRFSN